MYSDMCICIYICNIIYVLFVKLTLSVVFGDDRVCGTRE